MSSMKGRSRPVKCPECGERFKVPVQLSPRVHALDLTVSRGAVVDVDVDVQVIWDHAAKHVRDEVP